ncbi:MAG TPA: hypothetical protein VFR81_03555 [Longimicrobium sp.]|nr:hypothetical protein [Longimicrobium sp.]
MTPATYENSVFINCPFDTMYRPLLEAIIFAVYACGFFPRCALEGNDSSEVRIDRITSIIRQCRLAIHDISQTHLDPQTGLPRFNMPFELGIFVGAKAFGGRDQRRKACVVLDSERHRYQAFISDIAGQDIRDHGREVARAIHQVRDFLAAHAPASVLLPGGDAIVKRYRQFHRELRPSCRKLHLDPRKLTFRDLTVLIVNWMTLTPSAHHSLGA